MIPPALGHWALGRGEGGGGGVTNGYNPRGRGGGADRAARDGDLVAARCEHLEDLAAAAGGGPYSTVARIVVYDAFGIIWTDSFELLGIFSQNTGSGVR
jgi:hypothetical protein